MDEPLQVSHWLPRPVPYEVEVTIGDALREAARRWPDHAALIEGSDGARSWTFTELAASAERVARALLATFEPGARIAVWSANRPEWLLLQFGAALAGLTLVTVNPSYLAAELELVLVQSRAQGLFVGWHAASRDLMAIARAVVPKLTGLRSVVSFEEWDAFLRSASGGPTSLPRVAPTDPAQIQYTSGTTGVPKGALLTHRGLALNGRLYAETIGCGPDDVWVNAMPLFHTAGCGLATLGALQTGGTQVLPPAFDAEQMLDLFERHAGTVLLCVPTMLIRMLDAQRARPRALHAWRLVTLGGAPVPVELVRRAERELDVEVGIGFGQTEASPYLTHTRPHDPHPAWFETVGPPLPLVEVKVRDEASGATVPTGASGEICTRGPCVMLEYFDNPQATAEALDGEGWLHTGDVGSMDARGYLRIHGRLRDMVIRGGENIYPREIEDLLFGHPAVTSAVVVGVPDEEWGEILVAFVQLRPQASATAKELEDFCRVHLASFKVPRVWRFVRDFPQTGSGKIQKFVLRHRYIDEQGDEATE